MPEGSLSSTPEPHLSSMPGSESAHHTPARGPEVLQSQLTMIVDPEGEGLMDRILAPPGGGTSSAAPEKFLEEKKVPLEVRQGEGKENEKLPVTQGDIKYGELIVLGYNGSLVGGDHGRKKSKFVLHRREKANGVKPAKKFVINAPSTSKTVQDKEKHSVYYTLNRSQTVMVQYESDEQTDMFQIGRSSDNPIDFVVMDTVPGDQRKDCDTLSQSTISRFACRICVDRQPPYTPRIYAAGFDPQKNIFLGEKACKWRTEGEVDGLTTNGILLLQPKSTVWGELSIGGGVFQLRQTRSVPGKSERMEGRSNILYDGSLIDLCGATLLWRSASGLQSAPSLKVLEEQVERINEGRPQCPVGLNTLVLPKRARPSPQSPGGSVNSVYDPQRQPYVYLKCGHVHGEHEWGRKGTLGSSGDTKRTCTMCLQEGPFVQLQVGNEPSVYMDSKPLTHCFVPCAHMASESTIKHWCTVTIPYGCQGFRSICPFCATHLSTPQGYVKLSFQDHTGH